MEKHWKKQATLFFTFLKIGAFTFGGGYAMIALLKNEFVSRRNWMTEDDFFDMAAIAESTPGPIAINSATYIGYRMAGMVGAFVSTIAVCLPSFTIIYLISLYFDAFLSLQYVQYAFKGIQACVIYLILTTGISMAKSLKRNIFSLIMLLAVAFSMVMFSLFAINFSSVFYILICGLLGMIGYLAGTYRQKGKREL